MQITHVSLGSVMFSVGSVMYIQSYNIIKTSHSYIYAYTYDAYTHNYVYAYICM